MEIKKVACVYFSPTGGTRLIAEKIAGGIADGRAEALDVTVSAQSASYGPGDVAVIAAPCFGGRVPAPVAERMKALSGNGAAAVPVIVFGNRAVDDALLELKTLCEARGFVCVAAGAFVARHSVIREFGAGRPDGADLARAAELAELVRTRLAKEGGSPLTVPGSPDYRRYDGIPLHPAASRLKCGKCGKCARECPVGAIPPESPYKTDTKKCISCMRCVSVCPHYARSLNGAMLLAARAAMAKTCSGRAESSVY